MELIPTLPMAMALVTILIVLVLSSVLSRRRQSEALNLPPGPRGWPVLGSLGALAGALPPHRALAELAARHGPLMHLRLGSYHAVVASSADAARLVLKTHDLAFADRPRTAAGEHAAYGYLGIVHTPYGAYWRMARRLCATELFSPRRVDSYEYIRKQELRALVCGLFECRGRAIAVRQHLADATLRNVLRMSIGEKWSGCYGSAEGEEFRRTLDEAFAVTGAVSNVGEWVPWLGWLDVQGCVRRMKRLGKVYDRFLERILDEHDEERRKVAMATGAGHGESAAARDLVDVLLQLAEEEGETVGTSSTEARLTRDGVKAFVQDIIAGGTESSAVTMEWAMSELLRRPDAAAAATEELDRVVGRSRWVEESDLAHLPYIDAVVKETMRLHPVGPLLVPHMAREDTLVAGYNVPAGARVLVNVWAIARDPASWPDRPDEFRPERFAGSAVDVRGQHFELLPFGAGRRICPAYGLAMKVIGAGLANLLQGFAWRLPEGVSPADLSMEEHVGLSTRRKVPLVAVPEPRLPAHLYTAMT
ncbi:trimethyltridecatetraene synthase-like [Triticum dicoccoides]|uniref:trimethyltridecatetraene synthase-like n=1 Tax=Triticum dicoccoides TaxID=85692 RepID=UPI000E7C432A|nr:trimethyltridecatetraene synthase-like [Triticum dicoccoides]